MSESNGMLKFGGWGFVAGAAAAMIIGFSWGGWVTNRTATLQSNERVEKAVIAALVPICVKQANSDAAFADKLVAMKAVSSWDRRNFVEKSGWATMPGATAANSDVARACAELLDKKV